MKVLQSKALGHLFRSRLEARWAVAFTAHQIEWQYEPEGFDLGDGMYYQPDFWLPQVNMWAEVKPGNMTREELDKAEALARQSGHSVLLCIGMPRPCEYFAILKYEEFWNKEDHGCDIARDYKTYNAAGYTPFDDGGKYHLSEGRFFCNEGSVESAKFPMPSKDWQDEPKACILARTARFDNGELFLPSACGRYWLNASESMPDDVLRVPEKKRATTKNGRPDYPWVRRN